MVVLERLPGLEVEVHVNGQPAAELESSDLPDEHRQATRYIEAVSGAEFHVQWTFNAADFKYRNYAINGIVYVDGKYADGRIFRPDAVKHKDSFTVKMSGVWKKEKGRFVERPMMFSDIMMDEAGQSAAIKGLKEKLDLLGEITVKLYRGRAIPSHGEGSRKAFSTIDKVPERALKGRAVSHQASLGKARHSGAWITWDFEYEDYENGKRHPFAIFTFRYRSRRALQAECIIPRTPTPVPLEERPIEELTPEELRELVRRQREREAAQLVVKQELKRERESSSMFTLPSVSSDMMDSDMEINDGPSRKRQRTTHVEVIDLCDSD
ncbi:uncharacterized protein BKCO1_200017 [Diplodia corticola]|uniref:DUF7918 domain-containing protein n=1 Tax=Diplodia corticola TaxID=236234 RepID=A0A1J9SK98_9PEZI|nr:uncharacterized protein BKCO1_200017 [Diplodia corticola]OJD40029.1 hypothetical protein BKCO1_200017 [Diplodia corticola]